jgi:preprotein translocase subunit YajC
MNLQTVILQAPGQGSGWQMMVMMLLIVVVFYFFMMRPQAKKRKEIAKFRQGLKKGDKIVTAGGIYGRIKEVKDDSDTILLEVDDNVHIRVDKASVYATASDTQQNTK